MSIWVVAIAANLSALWILIANSFMQEPVGYILRNGRAEMIDFLALITNPHVFYQYPHTVLSGFVTAAFFVMGISAYHLLKREYRLMPKCNTLGPSLPYSILMLSLAV
jgi:cytochrome d ubiquinol oxidase subunit I